MKNNYNYYIKHMYNNPELYIYEFKNYKDDIYFWLKIVNNYKPKTILEIGIGNGRIIDLLHGMVKKYDGIDFSKAIINYCKNRFSYDNVHLYHYDLKKCKLDMIYDLIILPFNVLNNFYSCEDLEEAFNSIKKLSNKNTIIVIDTIMPQIGDLMNTEEFIHTNTFQFHEQQVEVYENKVFDWINSTCIYRKKYVINNRVIHEKVLPNRIFFHQELLLLIEHYGFKIINQYGDYNFESISKTCRKQIMIIRRK